MTNEEIVLQGQIDEILYKDQLRQEQIELDERLDREFNVQLFKNLLGPDLWRLINNQTGIRRMTQFLSEHHLEPTANGLLVAYIHTIGPTLCLYARVFDDLRGLLNGMAETQEQNRIETNRAFSPTFVDLALEEALLNDPLYQNENLDANHA